LATTINETLFGALDDGTEVNLYTLDNDQGMRVSVTNLGGIVTALHCHDRDGHLDDVVLGFDQPQFYLRSPFVGALIGRYANRIANGRFVLDGENYQLAVVNNGHQLHGGPDGFDKRLWGAQSATTDGDNALMLSLTSADGEQGFPGEVKVQVTFILTPDNALHIRYDAVTDQPTHINMSHHGYFNLQGGGDVLHHELAIYANAFTPVDDMLIPTGELAPVEGTALDFRRAKGIGEDIGSEEAQMLIAGGYDHNFVLDKPEGMVLAPAARVIETESGRIMTLSTTEPGLQFYSGNFLNSRMTGKGRAFSPQAAFCLEPQHFPDSPNRPEFPSTILRPGQTYQSESVYQFTTDREV
jgi:aldose 1-epimerase